MKVMKKIGAIALAVALAVPVVGAAPQSDAAAKKVPALSAKSVSLLADTATTLKVAANKTKIVKTTWSVNNKNVTLASKKKTSVKIKAGGAGDTSAKVTAKVKYKVGKKTKTKSLTCKVKVDWLEITEAGAHTNTLDENTSLWVYFNEYPAKNINAFDAVPEEGEVYDAGYWTTNAASVVEVLDTTNSADAASGTAVTVSKVTYQENRGSRVAIDLGKAITEKTKYHVTLMGFKGCGSKMMLQTDIEVDPVKVTLKQKGYKNPEQKGDISLILTTDVPFNLNIDYSTFEVADVLPYITVKDEKGNALEIQGIVPSTLEKEGDSVVLNLKGGADSKKFTVEVKSSLFTAIIDPTKVFYLAEKTVTVDNLITD